MALRLAVNTGELDDADIEGLSARAQTVVRTLKLTSRAELDSYSKEDIFAMKGVGNGTYRELLAWRKEG